MKPSIQTLVVIVGLLTLISCQTNPLYRPLAKSNAFALKFYKTSGGDETFTIKVTDKREVNAMFVQYISNEDAPANQCTYDGEVTFKYRNQAILNVPFSLHAPCKYVTFSIKGKSYRKKLTPEGIEYLETVRDTKLIIQN